MQSKQIIDGRFTILHIERTTSTNADLVERAKSVKESELIQVLLADYQTEGRGRLNRSWDAKSGEGLLASILVWDDPSLYHHINLCLALASLDIVAELMDEYANGEVKLKWPNDLVVIQGRESKKLGGILAEVVKDKNALVIGIGINLKTSKLKNELKDESYEPIGLAELCQDKITALELLKKILQNFGNKYERLSEGKLPRKDLIKEAEGHLAYVGSQVEVQLLTSSDKKISGKVLGLNADGNLLLETESGILPLTTGDISRFRQDFKL